MLDNTTNLVFSESRASTCFEGYRVGEDFFAVVDRSPVVNLLYSRPVLIDKVSTHINIIIVNLLYSRQVLIDKVSTQINMLIVNLFDSSPVLIDKFSTQINIIMQAAAYGIF